VLLLTSTGVCSPSGTGGLLLLRCVLLLTAAAPLLALPAAAAVRTGACITAFAAAAAGCNKPGTGDVLAPAEFAKRCCSF
jgi:hypothetical protein